MNPSGLKLPSTDDEPPSSSIGKNRWLGSFTFRLLSSFTFRLKKSQRWARAKLRQRKYKSPSRSKSRRIHERYGSHHSLRGTVAERNAAAAKMEKKSGILNCFGQGRWLKLVSAMRDMDAKRDTVVCRGSPPTLHINGRMLKIADRIIPYHTIEPIWLDKWAALRLSSISCDWQVMRNSHANRVCYIDAMSTVSKRR